jgi:polyisoprenoid-binding protein YceI
MHAFRLVALLASLALGAAIGLAQTAPPEQPKAGTYAVDPARTRIGFSLLRLGFAYYSGTFSNASGTLKLDPAKPNATALDVAMPITSLSTGTTAVDDDLKSASWFAAATYPTAVFASTGVTATGPDSVEITGTLTLHGMTQTEILAARYTSAGINPATKIYEVGFEAATTIKRSDFGLTAFLPIIGDDVRLTIAGVFVAQKDSARTDKRDLRR